uniref:type II toxin-antitoxin system VapC family toxin n=1 Tax=Bordetella sputigena TaxID=1416810 RepID=UPI0039EE3B6F
MRTVVDSRLFMLDTDVCSYLVRGGSPRLEARLRSANPDQLCISVITRGELLYGLERRPDATRLARLVHALLDTIRVLPWEAGAAGWYARVRAQLDKEGTPIGCADTLIAAHAIDVDAVLVTNNVRHYDRIKVRRFRHENWAEDGAVSRGSVRRESNKP